MDVEGGCRRQCRVRPRRESPRKLRGCGREPSRGATAKQTVEVEAYQLAHRGAGSLFPAFFFLYQQMIGAAAAVRAAECPNIGDCVGSGSVKTDSGDLVQGSLEERGRNIFSVLRWGQRGVFSCVRKFVTKLQIGRSDCQTYPMPSVCWLMVLIGRIQPQGMGSSSVRSLRVEGLETCLLNPHYNSPTIESGSGQPSSGLPPLRP